MLYRISNPLCLDDLVVVARHSHGYFNMTAAQRKLEAIHTCLRDGDEVSVVDSSDPITLQLTLTQPKLGKAFLYLNQATLELHVQERYLFTGDLSADTKAALRLNEVASSLAVTFGASWEILESPGFQCRIEGSASIVTSDCWNCYRVDAEQRIEIESCN